MKWDDVLPKTRMISDNVYVKVNSIISDNMDSMILQLARM